LVFIYHSRFINSLKVNRLQRTSTNTCWYRRWYLRFDNACTKREGISMALTDIKVRTAKPTDKQYKLTDGSGMHLLVHPNGSKYWRLQ